MGTSRRWLPFGLLFVLGIGLGVGFTQRQALGDWAVLRDYQPSATIQALAREASMNDYGRRLFYVNRPAVDGRAEFNRNCLHRDEKALILGCYKGDRQGIHIFDVDSPELKGVEEVTAAHEMLHQAYDRLSGDERTRIDALLQDFYQNSLRDANIISQVDGYRQSEPEAVPNEMHSLFGTEVAELPRELEDYYRKYFNDRKAVVAQYQHYQAAFTQREEQIATYDRQLAEQKAEIGELQQSLDAKLGELEAQKNQMDQYRQTNPAAYNQLVPSYNALVDSYNTALGLARQKVDAYNALVEKRNAIALEEQKLQQELSSKMVPGAAGE